MSDPTSTPARDVLREALQRISNATPRNTNSRTAEDMRSWCKAVADTTLATSAQTAAVRDGWMPFDSAPLDGTEVLLYLPRERTKIQAGHCLNGGKTWVVSGAFSFDISRPTHWCPLPPPPSQQPAVHDVGEA